MTDGPPFAWIGAGDVDRHLTYDLLFDAVEKAFVDGPFAGPRVSLPYAGRSDQSTGTLLLMSAILPDALGGVKIITYNAARKIGAVKYIYVAFDPASGAVVALIDGEALSTRRTAAVSVVAATHLAKEDPARILVVGTGPVARELIRAYAAAYPRAGIRLWGRRPEAARAIVAELAGAAIQVTAAAQLDENVRSADIVSCATGSLEPLIKGDLLQSDAHVDLIGGFTPLMREADDAVMARAGMVVVDNVSAIQEAGDLCQPIAAGVVRKDAVSTLEGLFGAPRAGRAGERRLTVFKSVGNSVFDLAAARVLVGRLT